MCIHIPLLGLMIVVYFGFYVAESLVLIHFYKCMLFKTRREPKPWSVLLPKDLLKYPKISLKSRVHIKEKFFFFRDGSSG